MGGKHNPEPKVCVCYLPQFLVISTWCEHSAAGLQLTGGMNGLLLPCVGETNPAVVSAPYGIGEDLTTNNVVTASYKNPPHQPHVARCTRNTCRIVLLSEHL